MSVTSTGLAAAGKGQAPASSTTPNSPQVKLWRQALASAQLQLGVSEAKSATPKTNPGAAPPPTIVGKPGGLQFKLTWDASVAHAPPEFVNSVKAAAQALTGAFGNPAVVNVNIGWDQIQGEAIPAGAGAVNRPVVEFYPYAQVVQALKAVFPEAVPAPPPALGFCALTEAQAKALKLPNAQRTEFDAAIGFSSALSGHYDLVGVAEHELTEVLGRMSNVGNAQKPLKNFPQVTLEQIPTLQDLFRVAKDGHAAYSPTGGGVVEWLNTEAGKDKGDWLSYPNKTADAFDALGAKDVKLPMTANNYYTMHTLGYALTDSGSKLI